MYSEGDTGKFGTEKHGLKKLPGVDGLVLDGDDIGLGVLSLNGNPVIDVAGLL